MSFSFCSFKEIHESRSFSFIIYKIDFWEFTLKRDNFFVKELFVLHFNNMGTVFEHDFSMKHLRKSFVTVLVHRIIKKIEKASLKSLLYILIIFI